MSLIEQAAKRLEQLKNAGIDLDGDRAPALEGQADRNARPSTPDASIREAESREPLPEVASVVVKHATRVDASSPGQPRPTERSRKVAIDLAHLAAAGMVTPDAPRSQIADEFRVIKRPLLSNAARKSPTGAVSPNLIMVTSTVAREGKTFTAVNLAMSIATEFDRTVLLVDADVANPSLLGVLALGESKGLMDVLTDASIRLSDVLLRTNVPKLTILPAGTAHRRATELLASEAMGQLITEMANRYTDRIVVFDAPPLLPTTEARVLATHMGQVIVVVEANQTTHSALTQALATVQSCPLVMTILNKAARSEIGAYYGYRGYGE